jgi:hypothetical protein
MLAEITGELRLIIPAWGSVLLLLLGAAYLVFGTRWPRLFDVLSMTVLGCVAGLVACVWIPLVEPLVVIIGGVILGGLTALFRRISHAVLAALVLAGVLANLAALAVGADGFASYLVVSLSKGGYSVQLSGPNLARDPVLAASLAGLLVGTTIAVWRFQFSERLVTCAQGAALVLFGAASLVTEYRGGERPSLAATFPLTLSVLWLCLVVIGLLVQAALARRWEQWYGAADSSEEPGA